jgi:hypothetical protein
MPPVLSVARMTARPEEFWDDLLAFIEEGRAIPVVGPELLTIAVNGRETPLYRALAEQLLRTNGLEPLDPTVRRSLPTIRFRCARTLNSTMRSSACHGVDPASAISTGRSMTNFGVCWAPSPRYRRR